MKGTLNYIIGEHPEVKDRIVIAFDKTGIDVNNPEHNHFLHILAKVMTSQLYAKANNIPVENIKWKTNKLKNKSNNAK